MKKKLELVFKKLLLKVLTLVSKKPKSGSIPESNAIRKVLVIRLNRIGDALVTTPLIAQIKKQNKFLVDVLADEKNYFVFQNSPDVNKLFVYRKGFKFLYDTIRLLNAQDYDIVIDSHDDTSFTVSMLTKLINADYKIALTKENESLFSETITRPDSSKVHVVERILELTKLLGFEADKSTARIAFFPSEAAKQKTAEFVEKRFKDKKFVLGINISAGNEARSWGIANYRKMVEELQKRNIDVVLLSTTRDLKYAFRIYNERDKIFYSPKYEEFVAIMPHLDLLFSPDTSTVHMASMYGVPVFGLYVKYNTKDCIWSPYNTEYDCIVTEESNLWGVSYDKVVSKFFPFLEAQMNKKLAKV